MDTIDLISDNDINVLMIPSLSNVLMIQVILSVIPPSCVNDTFTQQYVLIRIKQKVR